MIEALHIPQHINTHLIIEQFYTLHNIHTNNWGHIYKIIDNSTNIIYLSNVINKKLIIDIDIFLKQLQNHINISHNPYIHKIEAIIENKERIYILYEYHELHLTKLLNNWNKIHVDTKLSIFSNIANSIHACHRNNITHMNIGIDKFYIDSQGITCLTDFSLSIYNLSENELKDNISIECFALGKLFEKLFSTLDIDDTTIPWVELEKIQQGLLENDIDNQWDITKLLHHLSIIGY